MGARRWRRRAARLEVGARDGRAGRVALVQADRQRVRVGRQQVAQRAARDRVAAGAARAAAAARRRLRLQQAVDPGVRAAGRALRVRVQRRALRAPRALAAPAALLKIAPGAARGAPAAARPRQPARRPPRTRPPPQTQPPRRARPRRPWRARARLPPRAPPRRAGALARAAAGQAPRPRAGRPGRPEDNARTAGGALLGPGGGQVEQLTAARQRQRGRALARQLRRGHARDHAQAVPQRRHLQEGLCRGRPRPPSRARLLPIQGRTLGLAVTASKALL